MSHVFILFVSRSGLEEVDGEAEEDLVMERAIGEKMLKVQFA